MQRKSKICTRCGVSKKLKEYKPNGVDGRLRAMCYECQRGYANSTYRLNHERQTYACLLCGAEYETRKANRLYCVERCRLIASGKRARAKAVTNE